MLFHGLSVRAEIIYAGFWLDAWQMINASQILAIMCCPLYKTLRNGCCPQEFALSLALKALTCSQASSASTCPRAFGPQWSCRVLQHELLFRPSGFCTRRSFCWITHPIILCQKIQATYNAQFWFWFWIKTILGSYSGSASHWPAMWLPTYSESKTQDYHKDSITPWSWSNPL